MENQPNEICSHLTEKASKGRFLKPENGLQNHSNEGKGKEKKKERRRRSGKEERKKKAMVALLVFIIERLRSGTNTDTNT